MTSTLPKYDELMTPVLRALRALDGQGTVDEIEAKVIELLRLTDEQANVMYASGRGPVLRDRISWARSYLKAYGLLSNPERRVWALTEEGWKQKQVDSEEVKRTVLAMAERSSASVASGSVAQEARPDRPGESRILTAHLQIYDNARTFLLVLQDRPYSLYQTLHDEIARAVGTPQDPTDWSNPDAWIPRRLKGNTRKLALQLWEQSEQKLYLRGVHHLWSFVQRHDLAERDRRDRIMITPRGRKFIEGDKSVVLSIDQYEGLLVLLAALEGQSARRHELESYFGAFCRRYTRVISDRAVSTYLRGRLRELIHRDLVEEVQDRYELTAAGRAHLEANRGMVESVEAPPEASSSHPQPSEALPLTVVDHQIEEEEAEEVPPAEIVMLEEGTNLLSVTELFHRVESMLPPDRTPQITPPETSVAEALRLMDQEHLTHLPVAAGREVLGVFSYRSFARKLLEQENMRGSLEEWTVEEFMERLQYHHRTDSWETILKGLADQMAVLVGNRTNLEGIITSVDAVNYLQAVSSPFVLLAEIEQSLRRIIRARLSNEELQTLVARSLKSSYPEGKVPTELTDMNFNDYALLVTSRENWTPFEPVFGKGERARKETNSRLTQTRQLRNDVFHFRRELTDKERNRLKEIRDWLEIKARAYEGRLRQ